MVGSILIIFFFVELMKSHFYRLANQGVIMESHYSNPVKINILSNFDSEAFL